MDGYSTPNRTPCGIPADDEYRLTPSEQRELNSRVEAKQMKEFMKVRGQQETCSIQPLQHGPAC
jgi:hypothetical protein